MNADNTSGNNEAGSSNKKIAKALLEKGRALQSEGEYENSFLLYVLSFKGKALQSEGKYEAMDDVIAYSFKGRALQSEGKYEEAIAVFDEIVQRFGNDTSPAMREQAAEALVRKANLLYILPFKGKALRSEGKYEAVYDEVVQRFGNDDSPEVRSNAAQALDIKGYKLAGEERYEEALAAYEELIQRFGNDDSPDMRDWVAEAFVGKCETLRKQDGEKLSLRRDQSKDTLAIHDEIVRHFGNDDSPGVRDFIARAFLFFGACSRKSDKSRTAIFDQIVQRFGDDNSPVMREHVADALFRKSLILGKKAAIAICDDLVQRFGNDDSPGVREIVVNAQNLRKDRLGR
jgi:tetratricopeptide (TPR) repeat protein